MPMSEEERRRCILLGACAGGATPEDALVEEMQVLLSDPIEAVPEETLRIGDQAPVEGGAASQLREPLLRKLACGLMSGGYIGSGMRERHQDGGAAAPEADERGE